MSKVLLIKGKALHRPKMLEMIRRNCVEQDKNGEVIVLPPGFTYELVEADVLACKIEVIPLE